jgi:dolichol-phosphate hexosyltransferase
VTVPPELAVTVLMPVYNELDTVEAAIRALHAADLGRSSELIVIDDGSTDGTRELLLARDWPAGTRVLLHETNHGKGAAVRTALPGARGEISAIFDADLEYDPSDLHRLIEPIRDGDADAVFGVRPPGQRRAAVYRLGNRVVTRLTNFLFKARLNDVMTGQKAVRTDALRAITFRSRGFEIEVEIAARLLQRGKRIREVPVDYRARASAEGKKLKALDGLRVIATLARCRLTRPLPGS